MIGTVVSRYRIVERIGQGGMGEVYLAHDLTLDRQAALKFIPGARAGDTDAHHKLLNEAQAAARLDHPFICKVYEVGESGEQPFIAMEYVDGSTLSDRLEKAPLPITDTLRFASEIAEAVDFAHKRGIVHRDLKPSNIMIAADGHVKVMDFGVAKHVEAAGGAAAKTVTATGAVVGTVGYMSPEQLRGLPVDARSDVFAFGVLLYEMAAGTHPFRHASPFSTADAILNQPAAPLTARSPDVPPLLAHIIARCLEKDRELRYASLRDVQIELSRLTRGDGVLRPGHAPGSPAHPAMDRRRHDCRRDRCRRGHMGVARAIRVLTDGPGVQRARLAPHQRRREPDRRPGVRSFAASRARGGHRPVAICQRAAAAAGAGGATAHGAGAGRAVG